MVPRLTPDFFWGAWLLPVQTLFYVQLGRAKLFFRNNWEAYLCRRVTSCIMTSILHLNVALPSSLSDASLRTLLFSRCGAVYTGCHPKFLSQVQLLGKPKLRLRPQLQEIWITQEKRQPVILKSGWGKSTPWAINHRKASLSDERRD